MCCLQNMGKLFAVSLIVAMFAVTYTIGKRNDYTASEKLADFLCPFQKHTGCRTPSLKLNGSTACRKCRSEGKAAPSFCCSPERQVIKMTYKKKTCRRADSTPMATPTERNTVPAEKYRAAVRAQAAATRTVNRLLAVLDHRASCPMAQAAGLVGLRVVYGDNYRRLKVNSIEHYPVPECGYFTVCDVWLELDGRVMCRLETPQGKQKHIICMKWLAPYGVTDTDIRQAHYYPNTCEDFWKQEQELKKL